MPFRLGGWEIGLILVIILIVFGVGKLPQVGGALGKGLRAFRKERAGESEDEGEEEEVEEKKPVKKSTQKAKRGRTKS